MDGAKGKITELESLHAVNDHYEEKVGGLKKARDARFSKGKQESVIRTSLLPSF
jgi:hypothetical protein